MRGYLIDVVTKLDSDKATALDDNTISATCLPTYYTDIPLLYDLPTGLSNIISGQQISYHLCSQFCQIIMSVYIVEQHVQIIKKKILRIGNFMVFLSRGCMRIGLNTQRFSKQT